MTTTHADRTLAKYLRKRLKYLEQCNDAFNDHLDELRQALSRSIEDGTCRRDNPEIDTDNFRRDYVLANTFRYTMLVGLCSYLEEAVVAITRRLVCDYDERIRAEKGNWLTRHTSVLAIVGGVDLKPIEEELRTFGDLITLRNCVVHAWGRVAAARRHKSVESAVEHIDTVEITKDGFLYLGDQVLPNAITAAEEIAEHVLHSQLKVSIT